MFTPIITWSLFCSMTLSPGENPINFAESHKFHSENTHTEFVVTFEKFSVKQREELLSELSEIQGIKILGSCDKLRCFYFSYDNAFFKSETEAFEAVTLKSKDFQPLLKLGTSISDVVRVCNV